MNLILEDVIKVDSLLAKLESKLFELKTSFKISKLRRATEGIVKDYFKARNSAARGKATENDLEKLKEGIDYILVGVDNAYNVSMLVKDFQLFSEECEELLKKEQELPDVSFALEEFRVDEDEVDDKGKKKKVKKSIVTAEFMRIMEPFLENLETLES